MKHYLLFGTSNLSQYDSLENINDFLTDCDTGKIELEPWTYQIFNHYPTIQEIQTFSNIYNQNMEISNTPKLFYRVMGFGSIRIFTLPQDVTIEELRNDLKSNEGEEIFNNFPSQEEFEKVCKDYDDYQNKLSMERQEIYNKKLLLNRSYSGSKGVYDIRMDEVMEDTSVKINLDYEGNNLANAHAPIERLFDQVIS